MESALVNYLLHTKVINPLLLQLLLEILILSIYHGQCCLSTLSHSILNPTALQRGYYPDVKYEKNMTERSSNPLRITWG